MAMRSCTKMVRKNRLNGEAACFPSRRKNRLLCKSVSVVWRNRSTELPIATVSPGYRGNLSEGFSFFPLTKVPALELVSMMNQPSSRRMSTAWSRDMVGSGRVMSQERLRPMEFSQYSTGKRAWVVTSSSIITGAAGRRPSFTERKHLMTMIRASTGTRMRSTYRNR